MGYLQARYLDPAQGQAVYPIQLTSQMVRSRTGVFAFMPRLTINQRDQLIAAGAAVLAARASYPDASLATLYERNGIPVPLHDAHRALDRIVDKIIGGRARIATESDRLRVLFDSYVELTEDGKLAIQSVPRRDHRGTS
jgi:hypothetical protein